MKKACSTSHLLGILKRATSPGGSPNRSTSPEPSGRSSNGTSGGEEGSRGLSHSLKKHKIWALSCAAVGMLVLVFLAGLVVLGDSNCSFESGTCRFSRKAGLHFQAEAFKRPLIEVDRQKCAKALKIPQVALMFLTRGVLFHEPTWRLWFKYAEGLVPVEPFRSTGCNSSVFADINKYCLPDESSPDVIGQQHLFNVYVHTAPSFPGFGADSVFHGKEIPDRVEAKWGTHALIEAARQLFKEALKNPLNQRFVQLSESGIPLYPPTLVWQQFMSETKSRINACQHPWMDTWRWHPAMNRGRHRIPLEGWRKSSQWMGLIRSHAEVFVNDTVINELFQAYCSPSNACYSDEHYVPTLLAYLGKDQETDCWGFMVNVDWSRGGAHPRTYAVEDIDVDLMKQLRIPEMCHYSGALKLVKQVFARPSELSSALCEEDSVWSDKLLDFHCPLFARKFPNITALAIRDMLADCRNRLDIVACSDQNQQKGRQGAQTGLLALG